MSLFHIKDSFTLTLIFYPSPFGINWNSPGELLRSTIQNTLFGFDWTPKHNYSTGNEFWCSKMLPIPCKHPHPISHVDVALVDNEGNSYFSGMSRKKEFKEITSALSGKSSFDKLVKNFPGYLSKNTEVLKWLPYLIDQNRCNWITFEINKEMFNRLFDYYDEYQKNGYQNTYSGFHADPLKGEGAGCAKYARSFLEIADLNNDDFENVWSFDLKIPRSYFPNSDKKPIVGITDMIFSEQNGKWGSNDEDSIIAKIYDPAIMYYHIIESLNTKNGFLNSVPYNIRNSTGLLVNATDKPAPTTNFWRT